MPDPIVKEIDASALDPAVVTPQLETAATVLEHFAAEWETLGPTTRATLAQSFPDFVIAIGRIRGALERI